MKVLFLYLFFCFIFCFFVEMVTGAIRIKKRKEKRSQWEGRELREWERQQLIGASGGIMSTATGRWQQSIETSPKKDVINSVIDQLPTPISTSYYNWSYWSLNEWMACPSIDFLIGDKLRPIVKDRPASLEFVISEFQWCSAFLCQLTTI